MSLNPSPQAAVALSLLGGDVRALWHGTSATPPDQYRFACDAAAYCGTDLIDDRADIDLFAIFQQEGRFFLPDDTPVCSRRLKLDRLLAAAQAAAPCRVAFAFTSQEHRQAQRMYAMCRLIPGVTAFFPLIEARMSPQECARLVFGMWGLAKPAMLSWLGEAVCLPCIRGTQAYYGELWQRSPEVLTPLVALEQHLGVTILEDGSLESLLPQCLYAANMRAVHEPLLWSPCACK